MLNSFRIERVIRWSDFYKNCQRFLFRLIIPTVSFKISRGNRLRFIGGRTESAAETGTLEILSEISSVDFVRDLVFQAF